MESIKKWLTYSLERFPPIVYILICGGFSYSSNYLTFDYFKVLPFFISFFGFLIFFFELRLMDELKDYSKDKIVNPNRPLPRGLLSVLEVDKAIKVFLAIMVGCALVAGYFTGYLSGFVYLLVTIYLYLMYKEFFISEWLSKKPFLYATSHQIILFPLCLFSILCFSQGLSISSMEIAYSCLVFCSFFSYEICRKMDPSANKILKNYLSVFGLTRVFFVVLLLGSISIGISIFIVPSIILILSNLIVLLSVALLFFNKNIYKAVEITASISLLLHIYAGGIYRFFN